METYDVAIIGAGTMGSAAAQFLSLKGVRVVAFETHSIAHDFGSHSGSTRIIRHAYFESPDYVPLVMRADDLWLQMEQQSGKPLLIRTGGINMGPPEGRLLRDAILSCKAHNLPYDHLSSTEIQTRWPQFRVPETWEACYDPKMGFLLVENCIRTAIEFAKNSGAEIHSGERVLSLIPSQNHISIQTDRNTYSAAGAIVCAGAWTSKILADLKLPLTVKRKPLGWFHVHNPELFKPDLFPIFMAEKPNGILYGFPLFLNSWLKIANHNSYGSPVDPELIDRTFQEDDAGDLRDFIRHHIPNATTQLAEGKICLYTLTPDEDFILDRHPQYPNILIAAGFSGHGFKFAPVVGEILADLWVHGKTEHQIDRFRISRFQ